MGLRFKVLGMAWFEEEKALIHIISEPSCLFEQDIQADKYIDG